HSRDTCPADSPLLFCGAFEIVNGMQIMHIDPGVLLQLLKQQAGQAAVIDIGARCDARCSKRLVALAPLDNQRCPFFNFCGVCAKLHALVTMVCRHSLETLGQKTTVVFAPDKAHVRTRPNKIARLLDNPFLDQIGPKLTREIKLGVDLESATDIYTTV